MKYLLILFAASLLFFFANAQHIPLQYGAGNTYSYGEKEGIAENDVAVMYKDRQGRLYVMAYGGGLYVIGNNYYKTINFPPGKPLLAIREIDGEVFLFGNEYVYPLRNDSIQKGIKVPDNVTGCDGSKPVLYFAGVENGLYIVYGFKKRQFYLIHSSPAIAPASTNICTSDAAGNLYLVGYSINKLDFFKIVDAQKLEHLFSVSDRDVFFPTVHIISEQNWYAATARYVLHYKSAQMIAKTAVDISVGPLNISPGYFLHQSVPGFSAISSFAEPDKVSFIIPHTDKFAAFPFADTIMQTLYFGTFNKPFRFFPYLKKYPQVFQHAGSSAIQAITQDNKGRVWAGSYEGGLAVIDSGGLREYREPGITFLSNAVTIGNYNYFIVENAAYGLQQYDRDGHRKTLKNKLTGYYQYISADRQRYYFGTNNTECLLTDITTLQNGKPKWIKIDSSKGYQLHNTVSITEDTLHRVWMSHTGRGWAVYYPEKKRAVTFLIARKETDFGFLSSYTDSHGTVWLGTKQRGLLYYNNYSSAVVSPADVQAIQHPLLVKGSLITELTQWGKWLIITQQDKMLLLDLDAWYNQKKTIIRYLNPQETGFTTPPEQNTILTDKRDSSIWFATSTMLYQWNIRQWLSLPVYTVQPVVELQTGKETPVLSGTAVLKIKPTENSLRFAVSFQSPDNMPRYMSLVLIKTGDSLVFAPPSLETHYNFNNLAPGNYEVVIQICQADGTVTEHRYPFAIDKFWWQRWRVWALASLLTTFISVYIITISRKRKLAEAIVKRKEAELETVKAAQQKKLAHLQVVSLSSQFRPHFILNALNTIGAQMDDKPAAEIVLSRLGESINLIFSHAQEQKIAHAFMDEWSLVRNIIHIHQLMYLKQLEVSIPEIVELQQVTSLKVPLGLLQIPVENALLHGLSNRETGPWKLYITVIKSAENIIVAITDNGVGRKKAATLSNYQKHGTGTKNISGILDIVNASNQQKITIAYKDDVFTSGNEPYGTTVIISIPIQFNYEA